MRREPSTSETGLIGRHADAERAGRINRRFRHVIRRAAAPRRGPPVQRSERDDLVARFADSSELELRKRAVQALLNKGVTLGVLGRSEEALVVYDDLVARFADSPEPELREQVARALSARTELDSPY